MLRSLPPSRRFLYATGNKRRTPQKTQAGIWFRTFFEAVNWEISVEVHRIQNDPDIPVARTIAYIAKEWAANVKAHLNATGNVMYTAQIKSLRARNPGLSRFAAKKLVEKFIGGASRRRRRRRRGCRRASSWTARSSRRSTRACTT